MSHFVSLSSSFHPVFLWIAYHGRVPAAGLHPNSLHGLRMRSRCLVPRGPHGAISGILAGGILGFGTADRFLVFAPSPRSCCDVWLAVFVLLQDPIHLPIHWHISCPSHLEHVHHCGVFLVCLVLVWFCGFLFVFAGLFSCLTPLFGHVGLCTGPRSLSTPQCGTYRTLHNSFNGTNTVLRPGESREGEGRKK